MNKKSMRLLVAGFTGSAGLFTVPTAFADCSTSSATSVTCSGTITSSQRFDSAGQNINITQGTTITTSGQQYVAYFSSMGGTLQNNGSIISTDGDAVQYHTTGGATLGNAGTITTSGDWSDAIDISEVRNSSLNNSGTLATTGANSHGINIGADTRQPSLNNSGNIVTTGDTANGINVLYSNDGTIVNQGNITTSGAGSNGIYLGDLVTNYTLQNAANGVIYSSAGNGITTRDGATVNSIINDGIIDAGVAGISLGGTSRIITLKNNGYIIGAGTGDAIVVTDSAFLGQLTNTGIIGALDGDAIRVDGAAVISDGVKNQGAIVGRINAPNTNLHNYGIVELLSTSAPSVVKDYSQTATGVLGLQADSSTSYGQLQATGDATLNGRVVVATRGSTSFTDGDELTNVVTAASITGTPSAVLDDSLRYQFVQELTGTTYSLKIVDTNLTTVSNTIATTKSNDSLTGVGTVVDTIINNNNASQATACTGALASTVCAITSSFNAGQVRKNVVQLAPLMDGSMPYIALNNLRAFGDIVSSRQDSVRGQGYLSEFNPEKYLWIRPVGRWDSQSTRGDYAGYNADTRGIAIGADGLVYDRTRLGLALGMSRTDVNDTSDDIRHDARVDSWNMLVYGGYDFTPDTGLTWQTGLGRNTTKGNRYLNIENPADGSSVFNGVAHSDYNSDTFQAGLGLQSAFHPTNEVTLTPEVRTDYYRVKDDGYQESGADDVGLKVDGATTEALIVSSKLKAGLQLSDIVNVHGYIGAGYDTMNRRSDTTAAFIGSTTTPFTYRGMSESPWIAMAGVGVTAKFSDVLDGTVQYDAGQRTAFTSQSVSLKVRYAF